MSPRQYRREHFTYYLAQVKVTSFRDETLSANASIFYRRIRKVILIDHFFYKILNLNKYSTMNICTQIYYYYSSFIFLPLRVKYLKNQKVIDKFGKRLRAFRESADLSQEQVHLCTGIGQSHLASTELGQVNTSISHLALYAELFGLEDHEMINYQMPIPTSEVLKKNVIKFLKARGLDPKVFLKQSRGITRIIEEDLLKGNYFNTPRYAREISEYCLSKYKVTFTTSQVSKALNTVYNKGLIVKLDSDKKTKFQYKKK